MEAFAGSAGYSCRYGADRDVTLIEKDARVAGVWKWLVSASRSDVLALPAMEQIPLGGLMEMDLPQEARDLIGFSLIRSGQPFMKPCKWAYSQTGNGFWSAARRAKIAQHIHLIKHWKVLHGSYADHPNVPATWFVDPPYQEARLRKMYTESAIDFGCLAEWCRSRLGQTIVCETTKADWLPFRPLKIRAGFHTRVNQVTAGSRAAMPLEAIWTGTNP